MDTSKLFDYFAVYGIGEELPLSQSPTFTFSKQSESTSSTKVSANENIVSHLRLRIINENEILSPPNSEFIKRFEIGHGDGKMLWLEVIFGRFNGKIRPEWNGKAISKIDLWYLQYEGDYIKIPASMGVEPVPIYIGIKSAHQFSHRENEYNCYIGNYDISPILNAQPLEGTKLILTFSTFDSQGEPPISDIKLVTATIKINEDGQSYKNAEIPIGYSYINVALGKNKDSLLCFRKIDPMHTTYKAELIEKFPRKGHCNNELNQAIPMFIFSEGIKLSKEQETAKVFSFMLSSAEETGQISKIYITALIFYEQISEQLSNQLYIMQNEINKVYMPKAICLISHWPFIDQYKEILKEIYRLTISTYELPIERVICNLIQEIPLPDQGITVVEYTIGNKTLQFSRPPPKYLPYFPGSCLEYLFRSLSIDSIIDVWSCILSERKILLISRQKSILTYAAMGLECLIFPFKWEQVFIPILPASLKNYIETIFPYIIGVSPSILTSEVEIPYDAVRVYLDEGRIDSKEEFPRLPEKLRRQLYNSLMNCANIFSLQDGIRYVADEAFDTYIKEEDDSKVFDVLKVRDAFLHFLTHLLKNYSKFYRLPAKAIEKIINSRSCFNVEDFLNSHKSNKPESLLFKLTETSLFAGFIESRFFSSANQFELEYFDEASRFKTSKNDPYFVKPYSHRETIQSLFVNNTGYESDFSFRYERFPRLNDVYFIDPRPIQVLATTITPKLKLAFKNDMLVRLSSLEWGKFLMTTIYRIWITVFAHCMPKYKENANLLIDLALYVMDGMKKSTNKPDEDMYRKLIEACGHCELNERVLSLFKRMKNQGIEPDARTHGVYVTAVAKSQELQNEINTILSKEFPANSLCLSLTLKNCKYMIHNSCPNCEYILSQEEIMMGWDRSYTSSTTACPKNFCEGKLTAKFTVILDKLMDTNRSLHVEYLSPLLIQKELENLIFTFGENILLSKDFCEKYKSLFWNMVLNFQLLKLPYFFIDPSFNSDNLPQFVRDYVKNDSKEKEAKNDQLSKTTKPNEDQSEGNSNETNSHSNPQTIRERFFSLIKKRKSSAGNENMSTKNLMNNMAIKKLFGPFIEEFRTGNIRRERSGSFMDSTEVEEYVEDKPQHPPELPQLRTYSNRS
ncbi:unnamed protein product [Blepharisma stoltei]|uniref:UDENN domain-containing protein n=1 Tax=Blepharisma stoltei TaxID=1481888 RepID=A0AAU9JGL7_9CILI|nr:unnamed protein product [Blepharisma stoltei]